MLSGSWPLLMLEALAEVGGLGEEKSSRLDDPELLSLFGDFLLLVAAGKDPKRLIIRCRSSSSMLLFVVPLPAICVLLQCISRVVGFTKCSSFRTYPL